RGQTHFFFLGEPGDEGDHPPRSLAVAPIGREPLTPAPSAGGAHGDFSGKDPGGFELRSHDGGKVEPVLSARTLADELSCELLRDLAADLVTARADGGPEPCADRAGVSGRGEERFRRGPGDVG